MKKIILAIFASLLFAAPARAQTFTVWAELASPKGYSPANVDLAQGRDGGLYGTATRGGFELTGAGTIFKLRTDGNLRRLYRFCQQPGCPGGPQSGLILGSDGNFYGTALGGANNAGVVYRIGQYGDFSVLYSFCAQANCADGAGQAAPLIQTSDGNFYGTTAGGGANKAGTAFRITPAGQLTTLYNFCSIGGFNCTDGAVPIAGLIQGKDGNFYGTTKYGGSNQQLSAGAGTVFQLTPAGVLTTLYTFCPVDDCADGATPIGGLVQGADGNFYGTTRGPSTIYQITPAGQHTIVYNFSGAGDGSQPYAALTLANDGNFYGTTFSGGAFGLGTIFQFTPSGQFTTLHSFDGTDGQNPFGGVFQATNGSLYGLTNLGGTGSSGGGEGGTLYSLSMPTLQPLVELNPSWGAPYRIIFILGNNLTNATAVAFNGTPALRFAVSASGTNIRAVVPPGATSGPVTVTTPSGTLTSNTVFQVQ